MAICENTIRDRLSENLKILEPGLTFIAKEFNINNNFGTNGRIDILAKDEFNNYVVIELKRSDQAARQGIHELFKYLSILSSQLGVSQNSIRAILVSTTWHELRVPFTEYLKITPYPTKGIQISIDEQGTPISSKEISLAPEHLPLHFSPIQMVYLYKNPSKRNSSFSKISSALKSIGVNDHFLISCDYHGNDRSVIYPHAVYFVFSSPLLTADKNETIKIKEKIDWDNYLENPDENFISAIPYSMFSYDDMEIGYPEKLRVISYDWQLVVANRSGRFYDNYKIMSDEDLIRDAMYIEGGSSHYLIKMTSPQFPAQWSEFTDDLSSITEGNSDWSSIIPKLMDDIKSQDLKAKVSCYIYSLSNTPVTLYGIALERTDYVPTFQLVSKENNGVRYVVSIFNWNGGNIRLSPSEFITNTYGSELRWMTHQHFNETFKFDDVAMRNVNIEYPLFEVWAQEDGTIEISLLTLSKKGGLRRVKVPLVPESNLYNYRKHNIKFMYDYAIFMSEIGLKLQ